jgi:hypothetical protein
MEATLTRRSVKIKLSQPIPGFIADGSMKPDELELKEPVGWLYIRLGEPRVMVFNASGSGYWVEQTDVIRAYLEELVVHPLGADVMKMISLEDAKAVKEAFFGFFAEAEARLLHRRSTSSSSTGAL